MEFERPRIGNAELGFESQVLGNGVARTRALEALIILGFLRGLSVRDVQDLLEEALGERVVGKSTVARICQDNARALRGVVRAELSAHDLRVVLSRRDLPDAAPRRRALRGRTGRLEPDAGRPEGAVAA